MKTSYTLAAFSAVLIAFLLVSIGASAEGENSSTVVVALGTQGGPKPNPYRAQPAHALQVNGDTYLIDAGNGVARQLALANIPVENVKKVFITHNHDDHNADLGTLMGLSWSLNSKDDFDVFGPAGTQQIVDGFMKFYAINAAIRAEDSPFPRFGKFEGNVKVHNIGDAASAKLIYRDDNVAVTAIENCHYHHDEPIKSNQGIERSYAFRFETGDRIIVFSGDTGPCEQLAEFAKGADVLVHEVFNTELMAESFHSVSAIPGPLIKVMLKKSEKYHTIPQEIGKLASQADVGMVLLTHVMPGRETDPDAAYTDGVSEHYPGKVVVARDLGRY